MKTCIFDAALLFKTSENSTRGICATYVDDTIHTENNEYSQLSEETESKFNYKPREWDNTHFAGVQIERIINGFQIHQMNYIKNCTKMY